jgi:CRP-like cAMP-binding protein
LIEAFGAVPMFARLAAPQRELIATAATPLVAKRGEIVVRQGEPGDAVYVVARGSLLVHRAGRTGEHRALNVIEAPGSFGELALLDGRPRSTSLEALDECDLLAISRSDFLGLLARDPRLVDGLLRELGRMIRRLTTRSPTSHCWTCPRGWPRPWCGWSSRTSSPTPLRYRSSRCRRGSSPSSPASSSTRPASTPSRGHHSRSQRRFGGWAGLT